MNNRIFLICLIGSLITGAAFAEGISIEPGLWEMTGQWQMTSHGDTLNGDGTMSAEVGGMEMEFELNWDGKRIGDCD